MNDFIDPAVQEMNLIRRIGNAVCQSKQPMNWLPVDDDFSVQLIEDLKRRGIVQFGSKSSTYEGTGFIRVNLTSEGWKRYKQEKRDGFEESYGVIAMRFDDPNLESFVRAVVESAVEDDIGCDLVDMSNTATARIIDGTMRTQIKNSAFVIADLTHDNHEAYWGLGYAEGLRKPVVYICEKKKFEEKGTHFDPNYCTTVLWSKGDPEGFTQGLVETLRRSLGRSS